MCGIIGIAGQSASSIKEQHIESMLGCLCKRGPDEKSFVTFPNCILGQTRLSIIDLAGGHQPMKDAAHPLTIVFNGEIYNYKDLRKDLEQKGHTFSTHSDTEVILKAYSEYKEDCPHYLDGMFAFAIWDEKNQSLFMARDRFGKKPLYVAHMKDKSIMFASEIKALFHSELIRGEVDWDAIDNYLTLMYIPPWKSVYKNIHVLPPAHAAIFKNGELVQKQYWSIPHNPISISYTDAKEKTKNLLRKAVEKRMIADVEIGSLLSGGVDSTLVTALAQPHMDRPIKTFSIGYENYINELPFAEQASKKIGTDHYTLQASANLVDELKKVIDYFDEPHADSSNIAQHFVSELAGSKVKVALSGDGADELFMGYGWYWKYWNVSKLKRLSNILFSSPFKEYIKNASVFNRRDREQLWLDSSHINNDILPARLEAVPGSQKINYFDLTTYLPGQLLTKVDRASMMHSVEIRSPFLDTDLAEFIYNIPTRYKMDRKSGKIILKDILTETMPREFVYRRKQGFGAPVKEWLKKEDFKKLAYDTLHTKNASLYQKLNYESVTLLLKRFYEKDDESVYYKIWTLLCLELWFIAHKKYHE